MVRWISKLFKRNSDGFYSKMTLTGKRRVSANDKGQLICQVELKGYYHSFIGGHHDTEDATYWRDTKVTDLSFMETFLNVRGQIQIEIIEKFSAPPPIGPVVQSQSFGWYFEKNGPTDAYGAYWSSKPDQQAIIPKRSQVIDHAIREVSRVLGRRLETKDITFTYSVYRRPDELEKLFADLSELNTGASNE